MDSGVRRAAVAAATIACLVAAAPAPAQTGGGNGDAPFSGPMLEDEFPGGRGDQETATPTRTATAEPTAEETGTPDPTASPAPTATAKPNGRNGKELPDTGSDPLRTGLLGLTLLGFGFSLRLSLVEARRRDG